MIDSIQFHNQAELAKANSEIYNVIKIQNFVRELLKTSNNKEILRYVIQLYPSIVSPEQAQQDIEKAFSKKYRLNGEPLFSDNESPMIRVRMAFANQQQQKSLLPELIKNETSLSTHATCFVLNEISPTTIDDSVRNILSQFMIP